MTKSLPISVLEGIKKHFSEKQSVLAVFLMGSAAQSKLRSDSDVDIKCLSNLMIYHGTKLVLFKEL